MSMDALRGIRADEYWTVQKEEIVRRPKPKLGIRALQVFAFGKVMQVGLQTLREKDACGASLEAINLSRRYEHLCQAMSALERLVYFYILRLLGCDIKQLASKVRGEAV